MFGFTLWAFSSDPFSGKRTFKSHSFRVQAHSDEEMPVLGMKLQWLSCYICQVHIFTTNLPVLPYLCKTLKSCFRKLRKWVIFYLYQNSSLLLSYPKQVIFTRTVHHLELLIFRNKPDCIRENSTRMCASYVDVLEKPRLGFDIADLKSAPIFLFSF